jgi:hypothetical protein
MCRASLTAPSVVEQVGKAAPELGLIQAGAFLPLPQLLT